MVQLILYFATGTLHIIFTISVSSETRVVIEKQSLNRTVHVSPVKKRISE